MTPALAPTPAKRPRTQAQTEAARRNGAKSKGPITPHGKRFSSRNNTRHGYYTKFWKQGLAAFTAESEASFRAYLRHFRPQHRPTTLSEAMKFEESAFFLWLSARILEADEGVVSGRLDPMDPFVNMQRFGWDPFTRTRERLYCSSPSRKRDLSKWLFEPEKLPGFIAQLRFERSHSKAKSHLSDTMMVSHYGFCSTHATHALDPAVTPHSVTPEIQNRTCAY